VFIKFIIAPSANGNKRGAALAPPWAKNKRRMRLILHAARFCKYDISRFGAGFERNLSAIQTYLHCPPAPQSAPVRSPGARGNNFSLFPYNIPLPFDYKIFNLFCPQRPAFINRLCGGRLANPVNRVSQIFKKKPEFYMIWKETLFLSKHERNLKHVFFAHGKKAPLPDKRRV
jgi:hypothetical protein